MKIEIEDRGKVYVVSVDSSGSMYHGENICHYAAEVIQVVESVVKYGI